jgi:hypothetical protein
MLPPDKRGSKMWAWVTAMLSPIQWVRDLWFGDYRTGSQAQEYLTTTTYQKYQRAIYRFAVYESLIDDNNFIPSNPMAWQLVQKNFIGLYERILYTGQTLVLTYALNKRFMTDFRQPPAVSDIYIQDIPKPLSPFIVGGSEANSSVVYANTSSDFVIDAYSFTAYVNMIIWVPVAVYLALDPLPANCDKIIRAFADQYIVAGIIYSVSTY